jgi:serine/threonine-protein kinase
VARLRTLGALELRDAQGQTIDAILSRHRRAALLVYLAVEGRRGFVRRETLFRVFWPELDQARARAALRQSLHVLRSEIGEDVVATRGAEDVGVGAALECDATLFEEHFSGGRFAEAKALYRGSFLNAFFISGAPDFERWVDERREAMQRQAAACEQQLANEALARGDVSSASDHLRQALELEPTDEATLRTLMRVLEAAGDRAGALREFTRYADALGRDYEIEPSAETRSMAKAIREGGQPVDRAVGSGEVRASSTSVPRIDEPGPLSALAPALAPALTSALTSARRRRIPRWVPVAALAGAVAIVASVRVAARPNETDRDEPRLVVMPFTVRAGPELAYLGEGMSDLLSTSLDGPDLFRAVLPVIVLRDARSRGADAGTPDVARATARRFGASHFVLGTVVATKGRVRFDARLFASDSSNPAVHATVEGSPDSIFTLVDRLTAQLIEASRGRKPAERLRGSAAMTTRSLSALRDYLSGERALRDGAFGPAVEFFRKAVANDTTFALAYYRMSMAAEWLAEPREALEAAALANRHSSRLSVRDAALLRAHYTMLRGANDEAERQYLAILNAYPDDAEAWLKLGEIAFHNNPRSGRRLQEAEASFTRVLSYEPRHRASLLHLVRIAAAEGDLAKIDSLSARYLALGVADGSLGVRLVGAAAHHDVALVLKLAGASAGEADESVTDAARDAFMYGHDPAAALAILGVNLAAARGAERQVLTHLQMAVIELSRGRRRAARTHFNSAAAIDFPDAVRVLEAFYALYADPYAASAEWTALRASLETPPKPGQAPPARLPLLAAIVAAEPHFRASLLAVLSARLGDTTAARRHEREFESLPADPGLQMLHEQLLHLAGSRQAMQDGQPALALKKLAGIRQPDSNVPINWVFPWHGAQRLAIADALVATGKAREAVALYGTFEFQGLFLYPFAAPGYLRAAHALERLGNLDGAAQAYQRVIESWSDADWEYRAEVETARTRLAAIRAKTK